MPTSADDDKQGQPDEATRTVLPVSPQSSAQTGVLAGLFGLAIVLGGVWFVAWILQAVIGSWWALPAILVLVVAVVMASTLAPKGSQGVTTQLLPWS